MNANTPNAVITLEIFDPPMCCPGGMCGPASDPALLDINEAILKLKKEVGGMLTVERYLLSQQAMQAKYLKGIRERFQLPMAVMPLLETEIKGCDGQTYGEGAVQE